ncbi:MAG: 7-cyano-7-deazaguanine synthase QueC [bacterium]
MKNAVVLLSGGMDSASLLHYVKVKLRVRTIFALSFNYGQKHSCELAMAKWQAKGAGVREHRVADIRFLKQLLAGASALTDNSIPIPDLSDLSPAERSQPVTYVPHRNLILLSMAAAYAEAKGCTSVFYGAHAQDAYGYWDCTRKFVDDLNRVLANNRRNRVVIRAPFSGISKAGILKIGTRLGVDYGHTWSCYRGGRSPCGSCPTCSERATAFRQLRLTDPLR